METLWVELLKNGETCKMAIPCQAFVFQTKEGVETWRAAAKVINWLRWRESPAHKRQMAAVKTVVGKKICPS